MNKLSDGRSVAEMYSYTPVLVADVCVCAFQARSAEIPELRAEPLMRSCSSSTASMKVKNVKK